jgi:hypothetical protein
MTRNGQKRPAEAHLTLASALVILLRQPNVKINLKVLKRLTHFHAERYLIKFIENRAMESLTDSVRLRMPEFGDFRYAFDFYR